MRQRSIARVVLFLTLSVCAWRAAAAQQRPLTRAFIAGTEERYQVSVTIRVETRGISTEKIGDKNYADVFTHDALAWCLAANGRWEEARWQMDRDVGRLVSLLAHRIGA